MASKGSGGIIGGMVLLLIMLTVGWLAFKAVSGIFSILMFVAPILFILALILNHTVVTDYISKIFRLLKEDTGKGLLYTAGTILGYPLVAAWLAFKAYATRNSKKKARPQARNSNKAKKEDYIKYEEIEDEDFLELPDLNEVKDKQPRGGNSYDDMFN
jgi:Mn2+/Fe2+ NRAMP family transporter